MVEREKTLSDGEGKSIQPTAAPSRYGSTMTADRQELEMFKRDIDLSAFAAHLGYRLDKRESSTRNRVMRLGPENTGDKINISRAEDGHWRYYSFRDRDDNGTVVEFLQNRSGGRHVRSLGAIRKQLREWTHTERPLPEFARTPLAPIKKDRAELEKVLATAEQRRSHPYLEVERALPETTLRDPRFQGKWLVATGYFRDGRWHEIAGGQGNVLFPHRNESGVSGYEAKNRGFTGFAPGGEKGLWTSWSRTTDNVLVVTESAIDAMSHHALNPNPRARYASFAGQLNPGQPVLIERAISWMPAGSTIVAATDNDKEGHKYADLIKEITARHPSLKFERQLPAPERGKDWNDQLRQLSRSRALAGPALEL